MVSEAVRLSLGLSEAAWVVAAAYMAGLITATVARWWWR